MNARRVSRIKHLEQRRESADQKEKTLTVTSSSLLFINGNWQQRNRSHYWNLEKRCWNYGLILCTWQETISLLECKLVENQINGKPDVDVTARTPSREKAEPDFDFSELRSRRGTMPIKWNVGGNPSRVSRLCNCSQVGQIWSAQSRSKLETKKGGKTFPITSDFY